ncbi:hypothetical protein PV08_07514 [Exophiala spinifera]|uniref:Uncharacterized protein n=1 Tax=Exophiala spinifera TaxID=91928 RepID=A0A0D2B7R9_9EURO|nr:uncharacterized protein PV08_07514 [Exophiala spinifera]KIW14730.1 hypothetical protein PV08_07514 [Exophiala spinifera]
MTTTTTGRKTSGQPQPLSKLSYANASLPQDHSRLPSISERESCGLPTQDVPEDPKAEPNVDRSSGQRQQAQPRLTIRELREQAQNKILEQHAKQVQQEKDGQPSGLAQPVHHQQHKKKPSVFGGLFQKEPSQVALDQVKAQLKAQHGSTSATKVPNVRLEQMPKHVPKVNSRWDGIPEGVKKREKERKAREKDQTKSPVSDSFSFPDSGYYSREGKDRDRRRRDSRNSSSTTSSFGRGSGSSHTNSIRARYYAPSVNSSGDLAPQQRSESSHRPTTLPFESSSASVRSEDGGPHSLSQVVPPHASSTAPLSLHQMLQSYPEDDCDDPGEVQLPSSGPGALCPPASSNSNRNSVGPGFLAGEAQEFVLPIKTDDDLQPLTSEPSLKNGKASNRAAPKPSSSSSQPLQSHSQDKGKLPIRSSRHASEDTSHGTSSSRTKLSSSFGLFSKEKERRTK